MKVYSKRYYSTNISVSDIMRKNNLTGITFLDTGDARKLLLGRKILNGAIVTNNGRIFLLFSKMFLTVMQEISAGDTTL